MKARRGYQEQMRSKFIEFLRERSEMDRRDKSIKYKEETIEMRLNRMKNDAEERLRMIEEFRGTLEGLEFKEQQKVDEEELKYQCH
mmetsp:Transcript_25944/g.25204  ORF Transcript_25944/g.25204 Transcript_25944/m.25204 type:complete len:86 (+) Transcript_25944:741-998(+)